MSKSIIEDVKDRSSKLSKNKNLLEVVDSEIKEK